MTRNMKDSGIEWIGQIPEDWNLVKVKDAFIRKNSKANAKDPVILSLARDGVKIRDISNNEGQLASDYSNYNPVKINDLLLNPMDLVSGDNCNIAKVEGVISPAYFNLRYKDGVNPELYNFYFKNLYWGNVFFAHGKGVSFENRWTLNYETLSHMMIPLPSISEQNKIADFLIKKSNKLESIKFTILKEIKTLEDYKKSLIKEAVTKGLDKNVEMKDSGIEWIGEIPKHWELIKGKYILKLLKKPVKASDEVITCFRDGEVTLRSKRREEGFTFADKEIGYQGIDVGDLVVHGMDGFAGAIGISDSRGKGSPVLNVLDSICDKRYLMFYLRAMSYSDVFSALATGIRVRSVDLRWNKLANLPYPLPSKDEQNKIANFIENALYKTDSLISTKQKQLEILEEYKKSLIYEYVTGKKEVEDVGTI